MSHTFEPSALSTSLWGVHWLRYHADETDWTHLSNMRYRSAKVFEWMWNNKDFVEQLIAYMPDDAIFLARDYPLSEQHDDVAHDPVGTAQRHADDWADKLHSGKCLLPPDRTYFLGENEPHVWQYRDQAVTYYAEFCRHLATHGLKAGALNLSVGWPATKNNDPNELPDWEPYAAVHEAIVETGSLLVLHEYGSAADPGWGYWLMRLQHCPWRDVRIVIGECGIDEAVATGTHVGWLHQMSAQEYCEWLDAYHARLTADGRIHSAMIFTYDFSQPWESFDVRPARSALETYNWTTASAPEPPEPTPSPPIDVTGIWHPLPMGVITQHWGQPAPEYAPGIWGHDGCDLSAPLGTPICAIADGIIAWADWDNGYGWYIRASMDGLGAYAFYAHCDLTIVSQGQVIKGGEVIGYVGSTGNSTGPHLHLEIRLHNPDGSYSELTPMPSGRCDPETWCALHGMKL